jgi:hypothetical protein
MTANVGHHRQEWIAAEFPSVCMALLWFEFYERDILFSQLLINDL